MISFHPAGNTCFVLATNASGQSTIEVEQRTTARRTYLSILCALIYALLLAERRATEISIDIQDFEEVLDPVNGERTFKLTAEAAARKGLGDLLDRVFEMYIDPFTGDKHIRIKAGQENGKLDDEREFTIRIDEETGHQEIVFQLSDEATRSTERTNEMRKPVDDAEKYMFTGPNASMVRDDDDGKLLHSEDIKADEDKTTPV